VTTALSFCLNELKSKNEFDEDDFIFCNRWKGQLTIILGANIINLKADIVFMFIDCFHIFIY
ncbi:MAG TPA: hypothetical protein VKG26_16260, partial [Bacteroidia bacterium]|nr:hypothetical protein [Bacteroidia bacterium]